MGSGRFSKYGGGRMSKVQAQRIVARTKSGFVQGLRSADNLIQAGEYGTTDENTGGALSQLFKTAKRQLDFEKLKKKQETMQLYWETKGKALSPEGAGRVLDGLRAAGRYQDTPQEFRRLTAIGRQAILSNRMSPQQNYRIAGINAKLQELNTLIKARKTLRDTRDISSVDKEIKRITSTLRKDNGWLQKEYARKKEFVKGSRNAVPGGTESLYAPGKARPEWSYKGTKEVQQARKVGQYRPDIAARRQAKAAEKARAKELRKAERQASKERRAAEKKANAAANKAIRDKFV